MRQLFAIIVLVACAYGATRAAAAELVMFEAAGCPYCARWHREIGPIYPKTEEAKRAPLRRVDNAAPRPRDLLGIGRIVYTPTFVLVHEGRELGRIVGYGGEEMFWPLLGELMTALDKAPPDRAPRSDEKPPPPGTATDVDQRSTEKDRSQKP